MSAPSWLEPTLEQVAQARVAVFGDFALDAYWELDPDESERSVETGKPVRKVRAQHYSLGGAGNVAKNLAALGVAEVRAIGLLGADLFGDCMLGLMQERGIDTGGVHRSQLDWHTPVFGKPHRGDVEMSRLDFGAFNELDQDSFDRLQVSLEAAAQECDVVILNQQIPIGICPSPVIAWLNQLIRQHPTGRFLVDSRDRPHEFDGAILKLNESEARAMQDDPRSAPLMLAKRLHERVEAPAFVTCGAHGLVAADADGSYQVPGIGLTPPIDPCGAGDTIVGALAAALGGGVAVPVAAEFANLAAAVTVQKFMRTGSAAPDEIRELAAR